MSAEDGYNNNDTAIPPVLKCGGLLTRGVRPFRVYGPREFSDYMNAQRWKFAKTYAKKCPHEYIVRGSDQEFFEAVKFIRSAGFEAFYFKRKGLYYISGDHYYWEMGGPVSAVGVINRALLSDYILYQRSWVWKGAKQ